MFKNNARVQYQERSNLQMDGVVISPFPSLILENYQRAFYKLKCGMKDRDPIEMHYLAVIFKDGTKMK